MSILIYAESESGTIKKSTFEVASYASALAQQYNTTVTALTVGVDEVSNLAKYGVHKVLKVSSSAHFNAKVHAHFIEQAVEKEGSELVLLSSGLNSKYLAPFLAISLDAGLATNIVAPPESITPFIVKRNAFTNKAFESCQIDAKYKILTLATNAFGVFENAVKLTEEEFIPEEIDSTLSIQSIDRATDKVTIADADIVVSGGRGLKGPEHWGMIEELAEVLGAATACSKPVSDLGWRPHSEHVGQTGKPVACNLYIAIGISGAIQHLAGVNASKVKLVINSDPEAPFFKAADYGVVGDAFEVVPQLIEKLKRFKTNNN